MACTEKALGAIAVSRPGSVFSVYAGSVHSRGAGFGRGGGDRATEDFGDTDVLVEASSSRSSTIAGP